MRIFFGFPVFSGFLRIFADFNFLSQFFLEKYKFFIFIFCKKIIYFFYIFFFYFLVFLLKSAQKICPIFGNFPRSMSENPHFPSTVCLYNISFSLLGTSLSRCVYICLYFFPQRSLLKIYVEAYETLSL